MYVFVVVELHESCVALTLCVHYWKWVNRINAEFARVPVSVYWYSKLGSARPKIRNGITMTFAANLICIPHGPLSSNQGLKIDVRNMSDLVIKRECITSL